MKQTTENRTRFLGTYFDRDAVLQVARWANILAWVLLAYYAYMTLISITQFLALTLSGASGYESMGIFERLSLPSMHLLQLAPGLLYFILLKVAQHILLILLDVEDNSRRAASNG